MARVHTAVSLAAFALAFGLGAGAHADHHVLIRGTVIFSNISPGPLQGVPAGTPVLYTLVLEHTPTIVTPGQVSEYEFNFAETTFVVGAQTFYLDPGINPPVMLFQNDNAADDNSDGVETEPDVTPIMGTPYQMRYHSHDILGQVFSSADITENAGLYPVSMFHHITWTVYSGITGLLVDLESVEIIPGSACDSVDFNGDALFPDTQDIGDFLSVFAGGVCAGQQPTDPACNTDIDFNNDTLFPDVADIESFLTVFAGGVCV